MSTPRYSIECRIVEVDRFGVATNVVEDGGLRWATTDLDALVTAYCHLYDDAEARFDESVPAQTATFLGDPEDGKHEAD